MFSNNSNLLTKNKTYFGVLTLFLFFSIFFVLPPALQAQSSEILQEIEVCVGHGGANCSLVGEGGLTICQDGSIDESYPVYVLPQCQNAITERSAEETAFLQQSGCFPPSEITCTTEESYQNLSKILVNRGLIDSELAKLELLNCRGEINTYSLVNSQYKQCLLRNGNPDFVLADSKVTLPLLKAIFCPAFYGEESSYDPEADLCICEEGYFVSDTNSSALGGQCTRASTICQAKYGFNSYSNNGNCLCQAGYKLDETGSRCVNEEVELTKKEPIPKTIPNLSIFSPDLAPKKITFSKPKVITFQSMTLPSEKLTEDTKTVGGSGNTPDGFVKRVFSSITKVILSIFD